MERIPGWPELYCRPFRELLCHPNLVPCLNTSHGRLADHNHISPMNLSP